MSCSAFNIICRLVHSWRQSKLVRELHDVDTGIAETLEIVQIMDAKKSHVHTLFDECHTWLHEPVLVL